MDQFIFLFYFVLFAATAGATFAFMWKLMSTTLEESRRPPRRDTLHPEMRDIKSGEEITANYNLYTYPKTGVGLQMI